MDEDDTNWSDGGSSVSNTRDNNEPFSEENLFGILLYWYKLEFIELRSK